MGHALVGRDQGVVPEMGTPRGETDEAWGPEESLRSIKGYQDCRRALVLPQLESHIGNGNLRQNDANLLFLDGAVHRRLRALINRILPDWRSVATSSDVVHRPPGRRPSRTGPGGPGPDFAVPIAEDMAFVILGLRRDAHAGLAGRLLTMSAQFDPAFSPDDVAEALEVGREVLNEMRVAVRDGTCDPGGALALLDTARREGELWVREQLASTVMLARAPFQNTANLLSFAACEAVTNAALADTMAGADRAAQRRCVDGCSASVRRYGSSSAVRHPT